MFQVITSWSHTGIPGVDGQVVVILFYKPSNPGMKSGLNMNFSDATQPKDEFYNCTKYEILGQIGTDSP